MLSNTCCIKTDIFSRRLSILNNDQATTNGRISSVHAIIVPSNCSPRALN